MHQILSWQDALQQNQKRALDFIRQATIYGERVTALEIAETDLIPAELEGRARTDRVRQIIQALEDRDLIKAAGEKPASGRSSKCWTAVEIRGVWTMDLAEQNDMSNTSTMSLIIDSKPSV